MERKPVPDTENAPDPARAERSVAVAGKGKATVQTRAAVKFPRAKTAKDAGRTVTALQTKSINSVSRVVTAPSTRKQPAHAGTSGGKSATSEGARVQATPEVKTAPAPQTTNEQSPAVAKGSELADSPNWVSAVWNEESGSKSSPEEKIHVLETELREKKRALEELAARASAERAELLARHAADRAAYDRIIKDAETTIAYLREQLDSRRVGNSEAEGDDAAAATRIIELKTLLRDREDEIRSLGERLDLALDSRVPKLELEIAIKERDALAAELNETSALLDEAKAHLEKMEEREARIVRLEGELEDREKQIRDHEQERLREESRRLQLETYVAELEAAVEDLVEENEQLYKG